jgi:PBP1b-binding outer membrane lipoprotein LpoB
MMKYLKYLSILFGVVFILSGCGQETIEDSSATSEVSSENLESVSFKIEGFT